MSELKRFIRAVTENNPHQDHLLFTHNSTPVCYIPYTLLMKELDKISGYFLLWCTK